MFFNFLHFICTDWYLCCAYTTNHTLNKLRKTLDINNSVLHVQCYSNSVANNSRWTGSRSVKSSGVSVKCWARIMALLSQHMTALSGNDHVFSFAGSTMYH